MNTSDLLEQLLRAGQSSQAQKGSSGVSPQDGLGGLLGGLLGGAKATGGVVDWVVYWAAFWVVAAAWAALPRRAPLAGLTMRPWHRWA